MLDVINTEGPVLESILRKRICERWMFTRAGNNIRDILDECIPRNLAKTTQKGEKVFWPEIIKPEDYPYFRYPSKQKESKRGIHEIPTKEIVNAMYYILTEYRGCKPDILFKESAAIFGISRITDKSEPYLEIALQKLMENPNVE
jgi:hypothetical protein